MRTFFRRSLLSAVAIGGALSLVACGGSDAKSQETSAQASVTSDGITGVGDYKTANELLSDRGWKDEAQNRAMLDLVCSTASAGGSMEDAQAKLMAPPYTLNGESAGYVVGIATLHVCAPKKPS
ncbi:Uncharacterised protein (plasmid) [Tsukamurella tyrosinosolvens]|uniref:DUF732 domain-containing protein n=1 Tax=Tsukamurella tyrosinosolvens TaxID=57704 RepID=A0A1H4VG23_TSUTY|nr:hypothetical protein [Tsukamurella tyrosinosolvens]KXO90989.1 hypothetical protein AXK58_21395 [Tsukamurella tyrosinosolvens]SEC79885.1 hypothetical protein SAMN04489793_3215 [Tsukamurella tyrosinosolvens]VEH90544.1 Uncharacterised protein [Tsukamurella tyrosinosolvens]